MRKIRLAPGERVVAVTPEFAAGPGWANRPLWVHIVDFQNVPQSYRAECIQPEDQTPAMHILFRPLETLHDQMLGEVNNQTTKKKVKA